jgi:ATP-dependent RNA helicase RhlE
LVEQSVFHVEARNKTRLLVHLLSTTATGRVLVFSRTKHGADKITKQLIRSGINASAIHGNKSQNARQRALDAFKSNRPPVLVATDVAARGLDIDGVSHVINYELPEVPEIYVHRIGRTGRAGATGIATSFCGPDEQSRLRMIQRLTRQTIAVTDEQPDYPPQQEKPRGGNSQSVAKPTTGPNASKAKKKFSKDSKNAYSRSSGSGQGDPGMTAARKKSKFGEHTKGPSAGAQSKQKRRRPSGSKKPTTPRGRSGAKPAK